MLSEQSPRVRAGVFNTPIGEVMLESLLHKKSHLLTNSNLQFFCSAIGVPVIDRRHFFRQFSLPDIDTATPEGEFVVMELMREAARVCKKRHIPIRSVTRPLCVPSVVSESTDVQSVFSHSTF